MVIYGDLETRKVIVVGSVGSEKTGFCKYISGNYDPSTESRLIGGSVTKEIKSYRKKMLKNLNVEYNMLWLIVKNMEPMILVVIH